MDIWNVMRERHSVRSYTDKPIEEEKVSALQKAIDDINAESGLKIQLFTEEPEVFDANSPHYGAFKGCRNYFTVVGKKDSDEAVGYYGEKLVLLTQSMGLNTCWAALTYKKGKVRIEIENGEKLHIVIALGYGETQGTPHKSKPLDKVAEITDKTPQWFKSGMDAVLLAPTAINQQQFYFRQTGDRLVSARSKFGPCSKMDLGIAKYHFELGAGKENFEWA